MSTGSGFDKEPHPRPRRRYFYPPHGTKPRRGDREFRCPPNCKRDALRSREDRSYHARRRTSRN